MFRKKSLIIILILILIFGFYLNLNYQIPILMYHSISPDKDCNLCVSEERFSQQMEFLHKFGYRVIFLDELINKKNKSKKSVVITFDDGYEDNYTKAYPILKKYNFSAAIFVIVNKIGELGFLNVEQLKKLEANKIAIESHTLNHKYLPDLNREELISEIFKSKDVLESILGKRIEFISYPIGGFNLEIQELVRKAKYRAAFTTNRRIKGSKRNFDIYALKRIKVTQKDNPLKFWFKVSGFYHLFRKNKPSD